MFGVDHARRVGPIVYSDLDTPSVVPKGLRKFATCFLFFYSLFLFLI